MYRKDRKNEFYTERAKKEGYPARAVYKLKEIDEKYKIIKKGDRVLDLGCAPCSWLLYISQKIGEKGRVLGIDIEEIKIPVKENMVFLKEDIMNLDLSLKELKDKYNVVVSDLAPKTSGIKSLDSRKSLELSEKAFELARKVLSKGGNFICKIFEGEFSDDFFKKVAKDFKSSKRFRPKSVIKGSKEFYIIAEGFKNPCIEIAL